MEEHRTIKGVQPSVIIGTPGRMNDHLSKQNFDADTVTTLVIDEFDKCLEFGFQEEMATVIGQLPNLQRRFLLSATDAEEIPQFTGLDKTIKLNFLNPEEQLTHRLHLYKVLSPEKCHIETSGIEDTSLPVPHFHGDYRKPMSIGFPRYKAIYIRFQVCLFPETVPYISAGGG